jgi:hypothetical protein
LSTTSLELANNDWSDPKLFNDQVKEDMLLLLLLVVVLDDIVVVVVLDVVFGVDTDTDLHLLTQGTRAL